jgi:DNA-directed RNA polymerase specialized sigma24 family protein
MAETAPRREREIDWNRARSLLRTRIRSQLGRCDETQLEDLAHEGLIILLRLARRDGVRNLEGLIVNVSRNVAINEIRRLKRRRLRLVDWDQSLEQILELPDSSPDVWDDSLRELWFLVLEFFRVKKAACHGLAMTYAELGDWKSAGERLGLEHDAVRQQWSRCARMFREELRRDPGRFREWMGDDA